MKILFKNATIYDGSSNEPYIGSICIENDKILSTNNNNECDEIIDCTGLAIAPGFIDAHSHNDWFIARNNNEKFFKPFLEQGITTQITGNCGFSPFGFDKDTKFRNLIGSGLFEIGDVEGETATLPQFISCIKQMPLNIAPIYGHASARIGIAGYENRLLNPDELQQMDKIIEDTLTSGALGVSLGLMYEPDRYADYEELKRTAKIVAKYGKILTVHGRACSSASTSYTPSFGGKPHNIRALEEMIKIARDTGVKLQYSHLIFVGEKTWKTVDETMEILKKCQEEGLSIQYDTYAYTYGASVITVILPVWYLSLSNKQRKNPLYITKLKIEIAVTCKILGFNFNDIVIAWLKEGYDDLIGLTVTEIAKKWNVSPTDAYIRLVEISEGRGRVLMHKYLNDDILSTLMKDENCLYMTDAWVEEMGKQNSACFNCFPLFFNLAKKYNIPTQKIIHKMSGATANRFNIEKRGYIKKGYYADLVIFDENEIGPSIYSDEGKPQGIKSVIINGKQVVINGNAVGTLNAGKMLLNSL
ncbi:N-acyl-D-amino-acid deacylase family protein [Romboutsia sp.]|uniref:N-acyl-D-amino-acid deacylase family protein n=1 Tax=Romboutsia sp. TaxID=1965302 RepID=UPI003F3EAF19